MLVTSLLRKSIGQICSMVALVALVGCDPFPWKRYVENPYDLVLHGENREFVSSESVAREFVEQCVARYVRSGTVWGAYRKNGLVAHEEVVDQERLDAYNALFEENFGPMVFQGFDGEMYSLAHKTKRMEVLVYEVNPNPKRRFRPTSHCSVDAVLQDANQLEGILRSLLEERYGAALRGSRVPFRRGFHFYTEKGWLADIAIRTETGPLFGRPDQLPVTSLIFAGAVDPLR
jgi:hypothetical protein